MAQHSRQVGISVDARAAVFQGAEHAMAESGSRAALGGHSLQPGQRWFVVHTRAQCERLAVQHLDNQGFRTFLPLCRKAWKHARRVGTRLIPLFPGYVFVALDLGCDRWRSVNGTYGVRHLFTGGANRPVPMPEGIVEALIKGADERGCLRPCGESDRDERLARQVGPLDRGLADWLAFDSEARLSVLMGILGGFSPSACAIGSR